MTIEDALPWYAIGRWYLRFKILRKRAKSAFKTVRQFSLLWSSSVFLFHENFKEVRWAYINFHFAIPVRIYCCLWTSKNGPTILSMVHGWEEVCIVSYWNRKKHLHLVLIMKQIKGKHRNIHWEPCFRNRILCLSYHWYKCFLP